MTDRQKTRPRPNPRRAFAPSYGSILEEGFRRRSVLKGFLAAAGAAALSPALGTARVEAAGSTLTFPELKRVRDTADHWPEGYERQILVRWGDRLFPDSPEFDVATLNGQAAERQFGYNNDFTQFLPLPWGEKNSDHAGKNKTGKSDDLPVHSLKVQVLKCGVPHHSGVIPLAVRLLG